MAPNRGTDHKRPPSPEAMREISARRHLARILPPERFAWTSQLTADQVAGLVDAIHAVYGQGVQMGLTQAQNMGGNAPANGRTDSEARERKPPRKRRRGR